MPPKVFTKYKQYKSPTFQKTATFLIIVESPSKCSKIEKFLGSQYQCIASKGHLRTIDSLKSIHPNENYKIDFSIIKEKQSHLDFMRSVILQFPPENIFIASDADREGEAIAWHICDLFQLSVENTPRILFREITQPAILHAIQNPTRIDMNLVRSQKARQVLDLFVGFKISPYLWKYIFSNKEKSLSAGRCQTPCLRLVYDNEKERQQQTLSTHTSSTEFKCNVTSNDSTLPKTLEKMYKTTATFFSKNLLFVLNREFVKEEEIRLFLEKSKTHPYTMTFGSPKNSTNKPPTPFNTSRLLQVASNQLHLSPKQTMAYCQILYQEGYITYMRTDSVQYSKEFLNKASQMIKEKWGDKYLCSLKNLENLENKDENNPHEAIRITHLETLVVTLDTAKDPKINSLYKLIWKNTVESCMSDSTSKITPVQITAPMDALYLYSVEIPVFLGWKVLSFEKNNSSTEEQTHMITQSSEFKRNVTHNCSTEEQTNGSSILLYLESLMKSSQKISYNMIQSTIVVHSRHKHYTEASLIQKLEDLGIGRPSTFSMLIETIQDRGYVKKMDIEGEPIQCVEFTLKENTIEEKTLTKTIGNEKDKLVIQPIGVLTIEFLIQNFNSLFSYDYTKKMEEELDHNTNPFSICDDCKKEIGEHSKNMNQIEKKIYNINDEYEVVFQRFGPVLRRIGSQDKENKDTPVYKTIRPDIQLDLEKLKNKEYTIQDLMEIPNEILGEYEEKPVYLKTGIYGPYIEWEDKKINIKHIEKPTNEIILNDVLHLILPKDEENLRKPPVIGKNMLRRITDDLSIRKGKFGAYIYYKTPTMGSPAFYKLKGFPQDFQTCELDTLRTWIQEKYNI
jgi:DNA topoisomerase-1